MAEKVLVPIEESRGSPAADADRRHRWAISNFEEAFNYHKLLIVLIIRQPHSRHHRAERIPLMCLTARDRYANGLLSRARFVIASDILTADINHSTVIMHLDYVPGCSEAWSRCLVDLTCYQILQVWCNRQHLQQIRFWTLITTDRFQYCKSITDSALCLRAAQWNGFEIALSTIGFLCKIGVNTVDRNDAFAIWSSLRDGLKTMMCCLRNYIAQPWSDGICRLSCHKCF